MKTAVDSSVLLDVLAADREFGPQSRVALRKAYDTGALIACDVVWSEVRANFPTVEAFHEALALLGVGFEPITAKSAEKAGELWRAYCLEHPRPRERIVADFLIGAHARHQADVLLTRDRGFYRDQFKNLKIQDPSA